MINKDIVSIRSTIDFLRQRNELLTVDGELDPEYEISGIEKALDGGPALLFEKIKGYPGVRNIGNVFSSEERTAAIFGETQFRRLKFRFLKAISNPIPPQVVEQAPCQEIVITKKIDVMATLPIIKHSEDDDAHVLSGGIVLVTMLPASKGSDISFKAMHFRGRDWGAMRIGPFSHLGHIRDVEHKGEKIPLTINICTPPAVTITAAGSCNKTIIPHGSDELGIAGALQGSPIEICKANTVEAYAIANSEWVIEGYLTPEPCWETEASERIEKQGEAPFFPEWHGYLGYAMLANKFEVTAITHRKDRPIVYTPLADSYEAENLVHPLSEACLYQLVYQMAPDLVLDVNTLHAFKQLGGLVLQVKKTALSDDERVKDILLTVLNASRRSLVIAVDEDVDIYSADDVLWAMWTRGIAEKRMFRVVPGGTPWIEMSIPARAEGIVGMDATLPFVAKKSFIRAHYPVDKVELSKWFSEAELIAARVLQPEYAQGLSKMGA